MMPWGDTGTLAGLRLAVWVAAFVFGIFAAIATIAAFFGDTWWLFDYLANLRWWLFWISLLSAVVYGMLNRGFLILVFVGAMAVNAVALVPMWLGSQPDSTGENSLNIVSIDGTGGYTDRQTALNWITGTDADLILIAGGTNVIADALLRADPTLLVLLQPEVESSAGHVVLGRQPWDVAVTPTGEGTDVVVRVTTGDATGTYDVITASGPTAWGEKKADRLAARLATIEALTRSAQNPVVVIGNLGTTRWTHGMRSLLSTSELRDATKGKGYLATSEASDLFLIGGWLGLPLDLVLMSPDATPIELTTGPNIGASHLPVSVLVGPTA
jgi:hypothetical protein